MNLIKKVKIFRMCLNMVVSINVKYRNLRVRLILNFSFNFVLKGY